MMYRTGLLSLITLQLLLASSMASSFQSPAPWSTTSPSKKQQRRLVILMIRGGAADEENPSPQAQPPQQENSVEVVATEEEVVVVESRLFGPNATPPGVLRQTFPSFPWHCLPDALTYARCLAIPGLMALFYRPNSNVATSILFAFASFTDWLDGYLARRWDITSAFGAFLDPVADKLMVSTSLILLAGRYGAVTAIPAAIILAREIAVSALREWMASKGLRDLVQVGYQGKVKTALTMASLTLLLLVPENGTGALGKLLKPSLVLLYLCTAITVTSGSVYFRAAAPILMKRDET